MSDTKKPIYKKWWFWLIVTLVFFYVLGTLSPAPEAPDTPPTDEVSHELEQNEVEESAVFDIDSLVRKNIDEIRTALGEPSDGELMEPNQTQLDQGTTVWQNQFDRDEGMLLVDFNVITRDSIEFFIAPQDPSNSIDEILALAGLSVDDDSYDFEPIEQIKNPEMLTGVVVRLK